MCRARWICVGLVTSATACSPGRALTDAATDAPPPLDKPNIILIISDDQRAETVACMPKLQAELATRGVTFARNYASTPLCCPGRSTVLTGRYAHNHGVISNGDIEEGDTDRTSGAVLFEENGNEPRVFAAGLKLRGYTTGFFGKYLNGYVDRVDADGDGDALPDRHVPPYWDEWYAFPHADFFYFRLVERGTAAPEARRTCYLPTPATDTQKRNNCVDAAEIVVNDGRENHADDLLGDKLIAFIRDEAAAGRPFFAYYAPKAPHMPADAPSRYQPEPGRAVFTAEALARMESCALFDWADRPDSVLEADLSDKPEWVQNRAGSVTVEEIDDKRRRQLVSLLAIDDVVGELFRTLGDSGILGETIVLFTSDNGYAWGEHWHMAKNCAYEVCARVPLIAFHPRLLAPGRVDDASMLMNADLAPTIAALAGAAPPDDVDGESFAGLLDGSTGTWAREAMLTECWPSEPKGGISAAIRTARWRYVAYYLDDARTQPRLRADDGAREIELYDLTADPDELDNLARLAPEQLAAKGYDVGEITATIADLDIRLQTLQRE
jgi:arylsulfatase A-like enzyme